MYSEKEIIEMGFQPAPADYFTGKAWLKSYVFPDDNTNAYIGEVLFEPGTRNNWHTHGSNQILLVREGICYCQEEGKPIQKINAGDFVNIMPGVKHWHGASPDEVMIHTAIGINAEKGLVTWMEPVTDMQYNQ
ncbi:cupin domain-containing protein [Chitinophaga sp. 212800010-3]|uniref:cupin domain-containing protein n=1 Tax=unclassified Chitinophaga TaxID=2619133 RepID=UPI002DF32712|nr:Cupin-2 domain-containing protein [Chitinophaga sp. 212800010-3]